MLPVRSPAWCSWQSTRAVQHCPSANTSEGLDRHDQANPLRQEVGILQMKNLRHSNYSKVRRSVSPGYARNRILFLNPGQLLRRAITLTWLHSKWAFGAGKRFCVNNATNSYVQARTSKANAWGGVGGGEGWLNLRGQLWHPKSRGIPKFLGICVCVCDLFSAMRSSGIETIRLSKSQHCQNSNNSSWGRPGVWEFGHSWSQRSGPGRTPGKIWSWHRSGWWEGKTSRGFPLGTSAPLPLTPPVVSLMDWIRKFWPWREDATTKTRRKNWAASMRNDSLLPQSPISTVRALGARYASGILFVRAVGCT